MPDVHARLSASGAKRWMSCPKSVALEELFPEEESSYATEGTEAHSYCEQVMKAIEKENHDEAKAILEKLKKENPDMGRAVAYYVEYCCDIYEGRKLSGQDAWMEIEKRLDFSNYVPGGFGTGDMLIMGGDTLDIIDYKHGKGVPVYAENNPQGRAYAIGAMNAYDWIFNFQRIRIHIVQPRIGNISMEELTREELLGWADKELKVKAKIASEDGGDFHPGEACQFCKARGVCRARAAYMLKSVLKIITKTED